MQRRPIHRRKTSASICKQKAGFCQILQVSRNNSCLRTLGRWKDNNKLETRPLYPLSFKPSPPCVVLEVFPEMCYLGLSVNMTPNWDMVFWNGVSIASKNCHKQWSVPLFGIPRLQKEKMLCCPSEWAEVIIALWHIYQCTGGLCLAECILPGLPLCVSCPAAALFYLLSKTPHINVLLSVMQTSGIINVSFPFMLTCQ